MQMIDIHAAWREVWATAYTRCPEFHEFEQSMLSHDLYEFGSDPITLDSPHFRRTLQTMPSMEHIIRTYIQRG
jgi:hypothetical protein